MWTEAWPTEPGGYWFYGWCFEKSQPPELYFVKVYRMLTGRIKCVLEDGPTVEAGKVRGMWHPEVVPDLPELQRDEGR